MFGRTPDGKSELNVQKKTETGSMAPNTMN
jgi:hypothetical protein